MQRHCQADNARRGVPDNRPDFKKLKNGSIRLFMTDYHRAGPLLHLSAQQQQIRKAVQIHHVRDGASMCGFRFDERVMLVLDDQRYGLEGDLSRDLLTIVEEPESIVIAGRMGRDSAQESRVSRGWRRT
jgi:hypothetical protein